jgi:type IV pilus assembly protein PilP
MMKRVMPLLVVGLLAGCSSKDSELNTFIEQTKQEQPGGVEPLPEIKPNDTYTYDVESLRSPFMPGGSGDSSQRVRPDIKRNREFLEAFTLDSMKMVGTMRIKGQYFGLVRDPGGLVHRVLPGAYLGQNEGKIIRIEPSKISITEVVQDGLGGYMERAAGLALDE